MLSDADDPVNDGACSHPDPSPADGVLGVETRPAASTTGEPLDVAPAFDAVLRRVLAAHNAPHPQASRDGLRLVALDTPPRGKRGAR